MKLKKNSVFEAVITASNKELREIGIIDFHNGSRIKVWDFGRTDDNITGTCSKFSDAYDELFYYYIPNKFIKLL